jgi:serine/threonine protein kinase/predicted ATPase
LEPFGKYQLVRRLGAGGMAEVFLAKEPLAQGLAKILVIKKIHPSLAETPQFRQMFEDEAKVAVNLNHPNIVQTFGYGQIGPTYFLAMEHVEGLDLLRLLNAALEAGQRIPFGLCAYLGQQIAKGLDYAHRKTDEFGEPLGIVHRDVSPQNILVSFDGMVKIVDFGIARARHVREEEGVIKGKFAYMSPEQASGLPVDPRSDIFATGIVLWELTCGRALFGNLKGKQAINAIKNAQVPSLRALDPQVPPQLEEIILCSLKKRPEDRFQTARDLHRALGKFFFELSAQEGKIFESGTMAAFISQVVKKRPGEGGPGKDDGDSRPGASGSAGSAPPFSSGQAQSGSQPREPRAQLLSESKPVVVVEGELSGLSALRRQVGELRAREALLDFLRVTEHVAYKHQAHTDRLDERGFSYVLGLPSAAEDDASRALHLSLALIEALDGISRELTPPLKLTIGLQRGSALVSRAGSEKDVRGPARGAARFDYELSPKTTQVARRLAKEAMPGEVLVGGGVYRATRRDWRFEELDAIELPDPDTSPSGIDPDRAEIAAHPTLRGARPRGGRAKVYRLLGARPRSERLADDPSARRLIGRDLELSALAAAHRAVTELSQARNVLLLGEAGVGKRTILDAFRKTLDPATHLVLRAVGRPSLRETPYAVITDIARDLLGVAEDAEPRELKRRIDAAAQLLFRPEEQRDARQFIEAISMLLGLHVEGTEELNPSERRHRLYATMRKLQTSLADGRTLVVAVEDMHWADSQSFEILTTLMREPLNRPVMGIGTSRNDERTESFAHDPQSTIIPVGELGLRERDELLRSRFEDPDEAEPLRRQILDRAGGNPFYMTEILESLLERGILAPADGSPRLRWVRRDDAIAVPTTVEAVVASRLDCLPLGEAEVIRRAALLGRIFRVDDLSALVGGDPIATLQRLAARGLIEPQGVGEAQPGLSTYSFRNLITREVAYGGLAPETRARLHRVAADRLIRAPGYRRGADDARLAAHLEAAGDREAAGQALIQAGLYARDNASTTDAFRHFSRALSLLPQSAHRDRYQAHAEREHLLRGWGKRPAQLREVHYMRKAAAAIGDRAREVEALCRLGLLYLDVGRYPPAERELARALTLAREAKDVFGESEALRLTATLLTNLGRNAEALELASQALAVVGAASDRASLLCRAQAMNAVGNVHVHTGRLRDAVSTYAEALVVYRRLAVRRLEAATLNNMGWVFVGLGEYEEALVHYKRSLRLAQEIGDRAGMGVKLANIGQTYADLGDFERAQRYLGKAVELHTALKDLPGLADAQISLGQVALRRRDLLEAEQLLAAGLELATRTHNRYQEIRAMVYLAFCAIERGDAGPGPLELASRATGLAREAGIANGEVYGLCAEALALERAGSPREALDRSRRAVALFDSGRDVDGPEEVLYIHAKVARAAGDEATVRESLSRAAGEIRRKARRLRDRAWRARYLQSAPAAEILTEAARLGIPDGAEPGALAEEGAEPGDGSVPDTVTSPGKPRP